MRTAAAVTVMLALAFARPLPSSAWGAKGHLIINAVAIESLPASLPAFLRSPAALDEIRTLGPEADRVRDSGQPRDNDEDPAHFLDLDDDATIAGAVPLLQLPPSREAYDTAVRKGHAIGTRAPDQYAVGFLPYSIADGWELVVKDLAMWRFVAYAEAHATTDADKAFYAHDRGLREAITLRDIGFWGHFVADGSQPLHVTVHFNGWGDYPNPANWTQSHQIHAKFETVFVNAHATEALVLAKVAAYVPPASITPILPRTGAYLKTTSSFVPNVYRFESQGALDSATPASIDFVLDRLAAGAAQMRDMIADAYVAAADVKVGYPGITVRDFEAGKPINPRTVIGGDQ